MLCKGFYDDFGTKKKHQLQGASLIPPEFAPPPLDNLPWHHSFQEQKLLCI